MVETVMGVGCPCVTVASPVPGDAGGTDVRLLSMLLVVIVSGSRSEI